MCVKEVILRLPRPSGLFLNRPSRLSRNLFPLLDRSNRRFFCHANPFLHPVHSAGNGFLSCVSSIANLLLHRLSRPLDCSKGVSQMPGKKVSAGFLDWVLCPDNDPDIPYSACPMVKNREGSRLKRAERVNPSDKAFQTLDRLVVYLQNNITCCETCPTERALRVEPDDYHTLVGAQTIFIGLLGCHGLNVCLKPFGHRRSQNFHDVIQTLHTYLQIPFSIIMKFISGERLDRCRF